MKELSDNYTKEVNSLKMNDALRLSGVQAMNSDAMSAIAELVMEGASYEDGFVWKNEDGSTIYNESNKPYGIMDKVNELREGSKSYLFKQPTGGGPTGEVPGKSTDNMSINDIINAGLKY
jgi:hypothetical protein